MPTTLSDQVKALVDGANFPHLATLMPDGSPQSVPVWVGRERDQLLICTGETSLKAKNTGRDPRVALSILDFRDPYREVQLRGGVWNGGRMATASTSMPSLRSTPASHSRSGSRKADWRS
jgi:PPOX class probable F420-dependent enzyme